MGARKPPGGVREDDAGASPEEPGGFLGSLLAAIPGFVTRTDSEFRVRYINRTAPGIEMEDVIGRDVFEFVAPEHHTIARACFEQVQRSLEPQHYEAVAGTEGNYFYYINYVAPVRDPDGSVGLCIVGMDITAQRTRENALRASSEKLALVAEATGMALWEWDLVTGKVVWDERMHAFTGRDEALSLEQYIEICVHPDDRELVRRDGERALAEGALSNSISRMVRPDGEVRWTSASGIVHYDDAGKPVRFVGSSLDITRQRSMEQQLFQAQKMQAVGNLTAGVAHNFNNMLMVILPALEVLNEQVSGRDATLLRNARVAAERSAEMVRQLMAFAGQRTAYQLGEHDVSTIVSQSVRMARQAFGSRISLRMHDEGVPSVMCDAGAIEQVLMNVMLNARDALANVNEPTVDVHVELARAAPPGTTGERSSFVRVRVRDNGKGMPETIRAQIFEPFFTTRLPEGTGLGLSTSYAIVREHGGWIDCASTPSVGTEMSVWLPVAREAVPAASPHADAAGPRRRLLLLDDDPAIREVVRNVLAADYEVVAVASVVELEELLETDRAFDVALVDQSLRGVSGRAALPALRRTLPRAPVLYFSGLAPEVQDEVDGVIQKPVSGGALRNAVAAALARGVDARA